MKEIKQKIKLYKQAIFTNLLVPNKQKQNSRSPSYYKLNLIEKCRSD